ncbi:uncharacterized protein TrAFT101_010958 [Trichoderma asperellum]|uniref:uncharacterized protein n=1 Tax=Trichoderma asperellum TaxID=101201 RepID=UPI00332023EB|nr:hypothetical protein TrAFT101_010958 [Trichoderma asperellum]
MADKKALIVALSGCSSSGKTTLARLLRDIFPSTFILHEDDFYRPETELPKKDDLLDWDCAEAIDIPAMAETLSYIRQHAAFPPTLDSYQDKNSVGECPVPHPPSQPSNPKSPPSSPQPTPWPPPPSISASWTASSSTRLPCPPSSPISTSKSSCAPRTPRPRLVVRPATDTSRWRASGPIRRDTWTRLSGRITWRSIRGCFRMGMWRVSTRLMCWSETQSGCRVGVA